MGLYEIVSLVFQAATLLVGILALCDSRKKRPPGRNPDGHYVVIHI